MPLGHLHIINYLYEYFDHANKNIHFKIIITFLFRLQYIFFIKLIMIDFSYVAHRKKNTEKQNKKAESYKKKILAFHGLIII